MICFLDMDGVIAEYAKTACKAHGIDYVYADPQNIGKYWMDQVAGITGDAWQKPLDYEFWRNLPKTDEADEIVETCLSLFKDVQILTTPSPNPDSLKAKVEWIYEHYPMFKQKIIMCRCKSYLAAPGRLLVDDFNINIEKFEKRDGLGVLVPRAWNTLHAHEPISAVKQIKKYAKIMR
jgi:5'(3')-deoxyribonucleotidase